MIVSELIQQLQPEVLSEGDTQAQISGGYTGDLLSWVMGCVEPGAVWVTIMTNANVVAVALLREVSAVILAEDAQIDDAVIQKAQQEHITLLRSPLPAFALCAKIDTLLRG